MIETSKELAIRIGKTLLGGSDILPDEILDDIKAIGFLDEITQQCVVCSWWVPTDDLSDSIEDESVCVDCEDNY